MPTHRTRLFCLLPIILLTPASQAIAQTAAPALQVPFTLPLADKTTAQAILLPMPTPGAWLVYATKTGQIGLWMMTPTAQPEPPPVPPTPVPPPPNVVPPIPDWIIPGRVMRDRTCKGACRWK